MLLLLLLLTRYYKAETKGLDFEGLMEDVQVGGVGGRGGGRYVLCEQVEVRVLGCACGCC